MNERSQPGISGGLLIALFVVWFQARAQNAEMPAAGALTNAAQLRALSSADAATSLPVRLRGVVTALNPNSSVFIQDETGGTFATHIPPDIPSFFQPGEEILVEGKSLPGLFLPGIIPTKIQRLGHAELPSPVRVSYDDLLAARYHYERVELSGIVRSVAWQQPRSFPLVVLAMGRRKVDVEVVVPGITNLPPLVDAHVRVVGLAGGYINSRRQLRSPEVIVSRLEDLHVKTPPPTNAFAAPLTPSSALLNFKAEGESGHRVLVRGVVTHQRPGEALFLRDVDDGLMVQTEQSGITQPGDIVEVAGFPAMGRFGALLEDAEHGTTVTVTVPTPS